jgi:hypothetical protein
VFNFNQPNFYLLCQQVTARAILVLQTRAVPIPIKVIQEVQKRLPRAKLLQESLIQKVAHHIAAETNLAVLTVSRFFSVQKNPLPSYTNAW